MSSLHELGWTSFFHQHLASEESRQPARIIEQQRSAYRVACVSGEFLAEIAGHLRHHANAQSALPAVGDWVLIDTAAGNRATIHEVLPRKSKFSRKAAGDLTEEQVVAANIDTVFLVTSLNTELNPRRVERYLTSIWDSGAQPVVILNKLDLCEDVASAIEAISAVAFGVHIHAVSSQTGEGIEQMRPYTEPGQTVALLGSSGVGKSTLTNRLLGHVAQEVRNIREDDDRGRHTTTARRLFMLPGGGMMIDTPGMRELQLWNDGGGLDQTFEDIHCLAEKCRFRDCSHESEPGCNVRAALENQELQSERFESYLKLRKELRFLERKQNVLARIEETRRWKQIHKAMRERHKNSDKA